MSNWEDYLEQIYFDPSHPASFSAVDKLHQFLKHEGRFPISRHKVAKWLQTKEAYSLHKGARNKFPRIRVLVGEIDYQWDSDLIDFNNKQESNEGYSYIFLCIDILSRYVWTKAIKSKKGPEIIQGFKDIFEGDDRMPQILRTDAGGEYKTRGLKSFLKENNIKHFFTQNELKASYAERVIKTIRSRIFRYFTHRRTEKWVDILADITTSYNNTIHSSIKMTPSSVTRENSPALIKSLYIDIPPDKIKKEKKLAKQRQIIYKIKIGANVRIAKLRHVFVREYNQKFTGELFIVRDRFVSQGKAFYKLKDYLNEDVEGSFYERELQVVDVDADSPWEIEDIIKTRKRRGYERESLVRWRHFPPRFDSWVSESEIGDYKTD